MAAIDATGFTSHTKPLIRVRTIRTRALPKLPSARDQRFVLLLTTAHKRVQQHVHVTSGGSTAARGGLLMAVGDGRDGTPLGEIGRALDLGPSSLSGLVDRMERSGLVQRVPDPDDGRAARLRLTDGGRDAREAARRRARELNALLADGFTDDELAIVARWLDTVRTRFPKEND